MDIWTNFDRLASEAALAPVTRQRHAHTGEFRKV
jgi:hypothetical protein